MSHDKLYLHIKICKQNSYGKLPSFVIAGRPAGFVNNDGLRPGRPSSGFKILQYFPDYYGQISRKGMLET